MTVLNKKIYNLKLLLSRTSKMMSSQNVTIPLASCAKLNEETYLPKEISTIDEEEDESSLDESNASENSGEHNENSNNKTEQDDDDLEKSNSSELNKMSLSDDDDIVRFKNCLVSFMYSSEDLFVQMEDFEEKITQIQSDVDDCLDPYILSESNLCIAQYKEVINHIFK